MLRIEGMVGQRMMGRSNSRGARVASLAILLVTMAVGAVWASDAPQVDRLFDAGARSTPAAVAAARKQFDVLRKQHPRDARLDYAYGLVLLNQHRYREAAPLISRYLESGARDPQAYCAKIFVQLHDRRYREALATMVLLSKALPKGEADDEAVRFLGTSLGYLEHARQGIVDEKFLADRAADILANLSEGSTKSFQDARRQVFQRLVEFKDQQQARYLASQEAREDIKQRATDDLTKAREKIADQDDKLQTDQEKLLAVQRELDLLEVELAALEPDRTRVGVQIMVVQSQLGELQLEAFNSRRVGMADVARANSLAMTAMALNRQALQMDRKIGALQARAVELGGRGQLAARSIAKTEATAARIEKQAQITEKQLRRYEAPAKPRPAVPTGKAILLSTYLSYPYEVEKQRVLEWFAE